MQRYAAKFFLLSACIMQLTQSEKMGGMRGRLVQSESCILTRVDKQMANGVIREYLDCELADADAYLVGSRFVKIEGLDKSELAGDFVSGVSTLLVEGAEFEKGKLKVPKGANMVYEKIEPRGPYAKKHKMGGHTEAGRALGPLVEDRKVLAVRVVAANGSATTTSSLADIGNFIFGTNGDTNNMRDRFRTCSYGDVLMEPSQITTTTGKKITDGVYELVAPGISVVGVDQGDVADAVEIELERQLGTLPDQFDHVMICLPPGTKDPSIAYANVGGWKSVYNDDWCNSPSAQVHELGHNLGLGHANEGSEAYGDTTGFMGSSSERNTDQRCYNPAKSWQLGWYSARRIELDFSTRGGFAGTLVGIIDYRSNEAVEKYVNIKVEGGVEDVYIGFNVEDGFNEDTREAKDLVTVITQGDSLGDASLLTNKLGQDGEAVIPNFRDGKDLIIQVSDMDLSAKPPFAKVNIHLSGCNATVCSEECNNIFCPDTDECQHDSDCVLGDDCVLGTCDGGSCFYDTSTCDGPFVMDLTTDQNPEQTRWELVDECDGGSVVLSGGPFQSADTSFTKSKDFSQSMFTLYVFDSSGDGLSAGNGGFFASFNGIEVGSGANFGSEARFFFGDDNCDIPFKDVGDNGGFGFPLGECQGDCDNDEECAGALICFQRDALGSVPGCVGTSSYNFDYCYKHIDTYGELEDKGWTPNANDLPLGVCEGDCDADSNCAGELLCFQRNDETPIPGCTAGGQAGMDFCYNTTQGVTPITRPPRLPTAQPTTGQPSASPSATPTGIPSSTPSGSPSVSPSASPTQAPSKSPTNVPSTSPSASPSVRPSVSPTVVPSSSPTRAPVPVPLEPTAWPSTNPTGIPSAPPSAAPSVSPSASPTQSPSKSPTKNPSTSPSASPTGSPSVTPSMAPTQSPSESPSRYPTPSPSASPTGSPSASPSKTPTTSPSATPTVAPVAPSPQTDLFLNEVGKDDGTGFPLGECEGDCDNDNECIGGLVCFKRADDRKVPGCQGSGSRGWDYCYRHVATYGSLVYVSDGDTGYGVCQGDCDSDSDCNDGLLCYQRGSGLVPGCEGTGLSSKDICYDPTQGVDNDSTPAPTSPPTSAPAVDPVNWEIIFEDDLEKGFDVFDKPAGREARITRHKHHGGGKKSIQIKDNKSNSYVYTPQSYNVDQYSEARLSFFFYTHGADSSEKFYIEQSSDRGTSWQTIQYFEKDRLLDGFDNDTWTEASVEWLFDANDSSIQLRFRSGFNSPKKKIYIDSVVFEGK